LQPLEGALVTAAQAPGHGRAVAPQGLRDLCVRVPGVPHCQRLLAPLGLHGAARLPQGLPPYPRHRPLPFPLPTCLAKPAGGSRRPTPTPADRQACALTITHRPVAVNPFLFKRSAVCYFPSEEVPGPRPREPPHAESLSP